jgi:hypothetical protein
VNAATVKYLAKHRRAEVSAEEAAATRCRRPSKIHKALGVQAKMIRGIYLDKT